MDCYIWQHAASVKKQSELHSKEIFGEKFSTALKITRSSIFRDMTQWLYLLPASCRSLVWVARSVHRRTECERKLNLLDPPSLSMLLPSHIIFSH
jgi:hypothetical protein